MTLLAEDRKRLEKQLAENERKGTWKGTRLTDGEKHDLIREADATVEGPPQTADVAERGPFRTLEPYYTRGTWDDTLQAAGVTSATELVAEWVAESGLEDGEEFYSRTIARDLPIDALRVGRALARLADAATAWDRLLDERSVERAHQKPNGSGAIRWRVVL
jgi:hypothetical protein